MRAQLWKADFDADNRVIIGTEAQDKIADLRVPGRGTFPTEQLVLTGQVEQGPVVFTAPAGTILLPINAYFLVVHDTSNTVFTPTRWLRTQSTAEDHPAVRNWSIEDDRWHHDGTT